MIARIQPQLPQVSPLRRGKSLQYQLRPIPVGQVGGMHHDREQQPAGLDQQMALAPVHLLGPVIAPDPPFSVVRTDWLSRRAAAGNGSRPARARLA